MDHETLTNLIGKCKVCSKTFGAGNMAMLLTCSHAFHAGCARAHVEEQGKCPGCGERATLDDLKQPIFDGADLTETATSLVVSVYRDFAARKSGNSKVGEGELKALLEVVKNIIEAGAKVDWGMIKKFLIVMSIVAVLALLVFLCLYWPVIAPIAWTAAIGAWNLIKDLGVYLFNHFSEICEIVRFFSLLVMSNSCFEENSSKYDKCPNYLYTDGISDIARAVLLDQHRPKHAEHFRRDERRSSGLIDPHAGDL